MPTPKTTPPAAEKGWAAFPEIIMRPSEEGDICFVLLVPGEGPHAFTAGKIQFAFGSDGVELDHYHGKMIQLEEREITRAREHHAEEGKVPAQEDVTIPQTALAHKEKTI